MDRLKVVFRADASVEIGIGHVMRCLTLADELTAQGAHCHFICRAHTGNLIEQIRSRGYQVHPLQVVTGIAGNPGADRGIYGYWLGASQAEDSAACAALLESIRPDWLVVDHYALDQQWEGSIAGLSRKLMVIDDLADRAHQCDLLLDQSLGRSPQDYCRWVPAHCRLLCGVQYALLRPDFSALRGDSLQRRAAFALRNVLITMGGVDKDNVTGRILSVLETLSLATISRVTVVMGATAPWLEQVRAQAQTLPFSTEVKTNVSNMAELMAASDLAIGAAGATSWERCCLGLPTLMVVLAENQIFAARQLAATGAVLTLALDETLGRDLARYLEQASGDPSMLEQMSQQARKIVDGSGCRVVAQVMAESEKD
ncbi:UDP-2,4-diacetamido-2,4,6-trideoxy-beta-L-altropyranose hydrolase [Pseudomonas sp. 2(2015)]|uniref:UDP-2,4-diacetamido-2,4, 6-trideoxy-beta-L-altropyranose hydrolase n=1 Tax=Pseudomonas sp. 2(2015) TaxID=1619950 RepID=UPI000AE0F0E3|nr:UDP-2,4-diacetamido-2,4,6-trideoxy-beta-L-altropyranose hydrolase [Pseudomonas sp. 2(2015)]